MLATRYIARISAMIVSVLLPRSHDGELVQRATEDSVIALVRTETHKGITTLLPYRHALVRALIWQLKYKHDGYAAQLLGKVLAPHVTSSDDHVLLIPIPLTSKRLRERGYNQVTYVIEHALKEGMPGILREDILVRRGDHERQTRLGREARVHNVIGVFAVREKHSVVGRDIVLIDDVTTTGSTLREAQKMLTEAGARHVTCIALAH